jgi:hypothetical protein
VTSSPLRRRFAGPTVVGLLGVASLLAACGDDDDTGSDPTQATSPEDVKAPMGEVLTGLDGMQGLADEAGAAAAEGDFDTVLSKFAELHEVWEDVEGTVKDTDPDLYEAIETAQGLIKDGGENEDADRVVTGVSDQETAVSSFAEANG